MIPRISRPIVHWGSTNNPCVARCVVCNFCFAALTGFTNNVIKNEIRSNTRDGNVTGFGSAFILWLRFFCISGSVSLSTPLLDIQDLIAASIHEYSVGPSIRPISTECCFTMTNMIEACSNFHESRAFIINTRPAEIWSPRQTAGGGSSLSIRDVKGFKFGVPETPRETGFWQPLSGRWRGRNLVAAGIYDKYSVGPSIRPICT